MRRSLTFICFFSLSFWLFASPALALTNVTIDDTNGDPKTGAQISYTPQNGHWNLGPGCQRCSASLDASQTFDQTWHDGAHYPGDSFVLTAEVSFTGTAVYVYGIKGYGNEFAATDLTFLIDNEQVGYYSQPDINGMGWVYNMLFFSTQSLSSGQHTLTIQNGAHNGSAISLLLLDYIIYSFEEETSQGNSPAVSAQGDTSGRSSNSPNVSQTQTTSSTTSNSSSHSITTLASNNTASHNLNTGTSLAVTATVDGTMTVTTTSTSTTNASFSLSTANSSHSNTPVIIGSVVGAVVAILVALILLAWWLRRSKQNQFHMMPDNAESGVAVAPCTTEVTSNSPPARLRRAQPPLLNNTESGAVVAPCTTEVTSQPQPWLLFRRAQSPTIVPFPVATSTSTAPPPTDRHIRKPSIPDETPTSLGESLSSLDTTRNEKEALDTTPSSETNTRAVDAAISLAAEVQRLREENNRLREQQEAVPPDDDEVPPPYLQPPR